MSALDAIVVNVESTTGNVEPLLHEIRHALKQLLAGIGAKGDETNPIDSTPAVTIDLRSLPLAPGEEERLEAVLGIGEVRATLNSLGQTAVQESSMSGVWIITHHNADGEVVAKQIEITRMPAILLAQKEDIRHGLEQLKERLSIE